MHIFERIASRFSYTRKGRKIVCNIITGLFLLLAVITGSMISVLAASFESRGLHNENVITNSELLDVNQMNHFITHEEIPIVDSNNIKIIETYPWPLDGVLTCEYGWRTFDGKREFHGGIDISTGANSPIIAIADGLIECVGIDKKSYGLYILIRHDDGFYSLCAHLANSYVKEGDRVIQGQIIGLEGGGREDPFPGRSSGRHLHFEVRKTADINSRFDPLEIICH